MIMIPGINIKRDNNGIQLLFWNFCQILTIVRKTHGALALREFIEIV